MAATRQLLRLTRLSILLESRQLRNSVGTRFMVTEAVEEIPKNDQLAIITPSQERALKRQQAKDEVKAQIKAKLVQSRLDYLSKLPKTEEEKILQKIDKTKMKIQISERLLKPFLLEQPRVVHDHDPEVLTAEQLHFLKKMGQKYKNYVPVGKRGVYGGTIQNMHMHWKKHQTVQIDCHMFKMEQTQEIAEELARLSGGIVIDILRDRTIIMYRGRNYEQPKQLIPAHTLDKRKALKKALLEQSIEARHKHIAKLQRDLKQLRELQEYERKKAERKAAGEIISPEDVEKTTKRVIKKNGKEYFREVADSYDYDDDSDTESQSESESDTESEAEWSDEEADAEWSQSDDDEGHEERERVEIMKQLRVRRKHKTRHTRLAGKSKKKKVNRGLKGKWNEIGIGFERVELPKFTR